METLGFSKSLPEVPRVMVSTAPSWVTSMVILLVHSLDQGIGVFLVMQNWHELVTQSVALDYGPFVASS